VRIPVVALLEQNSYGTLHEIFPIVAFSIMRSCWVATLSPLPPPPQWCLKRTHSWINHTHQFSDVFSSSYHQQAIVLPDAALTLSLTRHSVARHCIVVFMTSVWRGKLRGRCPRPWRVFVLWSFCTDAARLGAAARCSDGMVSYMAVGPLPARYWNTRTRASRTGMSQLHLNITAHDIFHKRNDFPLPLSPCYTPRSIWWQTQRTSQLTQTLSNASGCWESETIVCWYTLRFKTCQACLLQDGTAIL